MIDTGIFNSVFVRLLEPVPLQLLRLVVMIIIPLLYTLHQYEAFAGAELKVDQRQSPEECSIYLLALW